MKKYKLSVQLSILFISMFALSAILFSGLVFSRLGDFSISSTLNRLTMLVESTKTNWNNTQEEFHIDTTSGDIAYIRLKQSNQIEYSSNILSVVNEYEANEILKNITFIPNSSGTSSKKTERGEIYYSYAISEEGNGLIIITNSSYTDSIRNKMSISVFYIFLVVVCVFFVVLFVWSKSYTTRLFRLKTHVKNLPSNNYEGSYVDDGNDEIAELSNTIESMRKELLHTEKDKREMLQNLSHDFKTPIAVIKSYTEAIKDGIEDEQGLDVILGQCDLLQSKVTKLLQYNRLEYLSHDKEFEEVCMKDIINTVVATYKHKNINIETSLDDTTFLGYSENYYTVVDNILDNASRFAKEKIIITLKKGELSIYNDGDHIDDKFIGGLFKAYEKGSKGQFGLGMSIVKKTLDFFGYQLSVKNEEVGVTFTISKAPNKNINAL
ncbi:MAG: sensor histidine kinase [Anaeroplasmataceae bacterium]